MWIESGRRVEDISKYSGDKLSIYSAEFMQKLVMVYCDASKIMLVNSPPYQHESMGSVERFNQTIQRMVTTIMDDSHMPIEYAPYAIAHAEYVYNRVPVQHLGWKTRYELVTGRQPDLRSTHVWGCKAKVLKPTRYRQHKFDTHVSWSWRSRLREGVG